MEIFAASQPWTIADDELEPVYAALADRRFPMLVHPAREQLPAAQRDWGLDACLAAPVNSSLGALRLILSGMLDRVPALTPIVPHLGGVLPFLAQRLDDQAHGANQHPPSHYLRTRLLYDTYSFHPPALRATAETAGTDRLLLGSDYPFRGPLGRPVRDIITNLPAAEHRAVLAGNAVRAFPPARGQEGGMTVITLRVNGEQVRADTEPGTPLLTVLRNHLGLKAAKFGCGQSLCGACTVWVDGRPTYSCDFPVEVVGDSEVRTLEALGTESQPHPLQQAFVEGQAGQCGYCLPGIIMRAAAFLRDHPTPSRTEVIEALDPNLCRCGSHQRIIDAVLRAAREAAQ